MKKKIGSVVGGAVATAAIPAGNGIWDWRILAGAAAAGAVGGFFGLNVAGIAKRYMAKRKAGVSAPPP